MGPSFRFLDGNQKEEGEKSIVLMEIAHAMTIVHGDMALVGAEAIALDLWGQH